MRSFSIPLVALALTAAAGPATAQQDTSDEFATAPWGLGLSIGYDPDITIDGDPRDDDCNLDNNKLHVSSEQLVSWAEAGHERVVVSRDGSVSYPGS